VETKRTRPIAKNEVSFFALFVIEGLLIL